MNNILQKDLGSTLLSAFIILGWIGLGFVFLRVFALSLKRILDFLLKKSEK